MAFSHQRYHLRLLLAVCGAGFVWSSAAVANSSPQEWLDRMSHAVQNTNYEGTVIRIANGHAEALKVVHAVEDGVVREKVIAQEGSGLEIIRVGSEVHFIMPDRKSVLVEEWDEQSSLFSALPTASIRFGNEYDLKLVSTDRVAGRTAVQLAIKPHDEYRYEHRIWLDKETGFPLQTQLIGDRGTALQQVKFADIQLHRDMDLSTLQSSYSTSEFKWYNDPGQRMRRTGSGDWDDVDLPPGFQQVSASQELMPGSDETITHILYSDGLARVSVFVADHVGRPVKQKTQVGASNSHSVVRGDRRITAVGDVPAATVERIANSLQPR